jgi:hypothetical protein
MLVGLWLAVGIATNLRLRLVDAQDGTRRLRVCREDRYVDFYRFHIVRPTGQTYMRRWIAALDTGRSAHLHNIMLSDTDRDPHGHPWRFTSIILWGGYREEIYVALQAGRVWHVPRIAIVDRGMFSVQAVPADRLHKVKLLGNRPAWTLCFTGPRVQAWGFATRNGWVHHRDYEMRNVA